MLRYKAKINLPGGITKECPLPVVKSSGTVLSVVNPANKDSVTVSVAATADIAKSGESYFLIGKATVSFFTADKSATYTIIMEGCDGNGNLGYKMETLKVSIKK